MTTRTKSSTRPCQATNPETCYYHRNAALAERFEANAARYSKKGLTDDAFAAARTASTYRAQQAAVESGDKLAIASVRGDIAVLKAKALSAAPHDPRNVVIDKHLTIERDAWENIQARAAKSNVTLERDLDVSHFDFIMVNKLSLKGEPQDVAYMFDYIARNSDLGRKLGQNHTPPQPVAPSELEVAETPTEHVATIPTFDDFKKIFGLGKKKN